MDDDVLALERAAARGWQAPEQAWLGDWLLRAADGFTGRANSALPLGPPGRPLGEAIDEVERWYRSRGLPPCIVVPHALAGPGDDPLDAHLAARGWGVRAGPAIVMSARSADVAAAWAGGRVELAAEPDDAWLGGYHYRGEVVAPVARALLRSAPFQRFASVRVDGEVVAIGRLAVADGWGGLTAMEVAPAHRHRGLATAVVGVLAGAAVDAGADRLYLQVDEGNDAGRALYGRCGFVASHRYHYRLAPNAGAGDLGQDVAP